MRADTEHRLFPWAYVIRFGLGRLRLPPEQFWALSLPELIALIGADTTQTHATREGLKALMAMFPDARRSQEPDCAPTQNEANPMEKSG